MADEKVFTIPLRKEWTKVPGYKRTKKAIRATKDFITRHMKKEIVKIGPGLNEYIWSSGNRSPPHKVKVKSVIEDDHALVELIDVPFQFKKKEEAKKSLKEKLLAKKDKKPEETKKTVETAEVQKEKVAQDVAKEQKSHEGSKPVPGTPDKVQTKEEEKLQKTKRVIPQHGKKDAKSPKP